MNARIEAKHTPGPWLISHKGSNPDNMSFIWRNDHGGDVPEDAKNTGYHRVCRDVELPANARLIAAAPDMLAALKAIAEGIHIEHANDAALVEKARAAIAKAEGR